MNNRTSKLNRNKEYEMDLSIESIRHGKISYSEVLKLEEQIRFMQTTDYKRFKDILNTLVDEVDRYVEEENLYYFSEKTMRYIINLFAERYICTNRFKQGFHYDRATEIAVKHIKLKVTSELVFDKDTLITYASLIAELSTGDRDYYEKKDIMESQTLELSK